MNFLSRVQLVIERHQFKRGKHKGEAPADPTNRRKTYFRVRVDALEQEATVTLYATDVIKAKGNVITLDTGGYSRSSITRQFMGFALRKYLGNQPAYLFWDNKFGKSQCTLRLGEKQYRFYDGIQFDENTLEVLTPLQTFSRRHRDTDRTTEFQDAVRKSGFRDMFTLLHSASTEPPPNLPWSSDRAYRVFRVLTQMGLSGTASVAERLVQVASDSAHAEHWADIVGVFSWDREWVHEHGPSGYKNVEQFNKRSRTQAWNSFMSMAKTNMWKVSDSGVTSVK